MYEWCLIASVLSSEQDYTPVLIDSHLFLCCLWTRERSFHTEQHPWKQRTVATNWSYSMLTFLFTCWPILSFNCNVRVSACLLCLMTQVCFPLSRGIKLYGTSRLFEVGLNYNSHARLHLSLFSSLLESVRQEFIVTQSLTFQSYILVRASMSSFVLRCWIDRERLKILICLTCGEGGSAPSWLLVPRSHIGPATQPVPQETHNYSRPFRLVQQPVQLWLPSLVIYFIPFTLLRGTAQHNDQASLYNNVCDDKHSGF